MTFIVNLKTKHIMLTVMGVVFVFWLSSIVLLYDIGKIDHHGLTYSLGALLVAFLLAISIVWYVGNKLEGEANKLIEVMERVSKKDFKFQAEVNEKSKNEIHTIAKYFNISLKNSIAVLEEIKEGIEQIASGAEEFMVIAEQVYQHSSETFKRIDDLAKYTEQLNEELNMARNSLNELGVAINEIAKNTMETNAETQNTNDRAIKNDEIIEELIQEIERIKEAADIIQNIADETNLLALNATIEAAKAGEAGKGFTVVAGEVKELSRETAKSTEQIRSWVENLVEKGHLLKETSKSLIITLQKTVERSGSIASAIEEQTAVTGEISQNIEKITHEVSKINNMGKELREQAEEAERSIAGIKQAAEDLNKLSLTLKEMTDAYKI